MSEPTTPTLPIALEPISGSRGKIWSTSKGTSQPRMSKTSEEWIELLRKTVKVTTIPRIAGADIGTESGCRCRCRYFVAGADICILF